MSQYGGKYRGRVVDNADPTGDGRLRVVVPEIGADDLGWALPSVPPGSSQVPALGDDVLVSFERGDLGYPVWEHGGSGVGVAATQNYVGKYRGVVVDNADPTAEQRLLVTVPEIDESHSGWAKAGVTLPADQPLPDIGSEVWIEYENGDPQYPVWVGVR